LILACLTTAIALAASGAAQAQLFVRAPFVRVQVGGNGVGVRVPFFNLFVPSDPPVYYAYPPPIFIPPMPLPGEPDPQPLPTPRQTVPLPPIKERDDAPPAPQQTQVMTLEQFTKNFQARQGNYEIQLLNPVTKQPTAVRFSLPPGAPSRVRATDRLIEFVYGPREFVRIEFDQDGALVTSR
jgi:hypothetical protein